MHPPLRLLISAVTALALIAAPAFSQQTAKPGGKPLDAKTRNKPAAEAGAPAGAPAATTAGPAGAARDHKAVLKSVAFEEARYRKRLAQLDRIGQIATEKKDAKMLADVAELREKNDLHHVRREAKLRSQLGDEQVDAALAFLEQHGKGKPVMPPKNAKAREAAKGQAAGKPGEKIKEAQEAADQAREKVKDKPEKP